MRNTFHDLETYSPTPIKDGTHKYAEKAEVMLWSWADEDGPVYVWDLVNGCLHWQDELSGAWVEQSLLGKHPPLLKIIDDPAALVWFQNGGMFDFVVLEKALPGTLHRIDISRWRDTMVQAYAHALPGALDKLGEVLNITEDKRKLKRGRALVQLFCKPDADGKRNTKQTHPKEWQEFIEYAGGDITTMREAHRLMPMWNYKGKQVDLWHADLRINSRGFAVDIPLAEAAVRTAERVQKGLAGQAQALTDGEVQSANQRDAMLAYILAEHGVTLPDMRADTLERRLADPDLPQGVRDLIAVRLQASMNSVSKFKTLLKGVNSDGRLRGCMQYRGAGRTGRWAHRMFQPGNLPRSTMPQPDIDAAILAMKADSVELAFANPMSAMSNTIRGAIIAPPGRKMVIADLSNIEGRVAAWLAGEEWKLDAFRAFDAGEGSDLYILAYAKSFNVPPESIDKKTVEGHGQRQIGKVQELMFQYGGGVGAWITGAATYGIDLDRMTEQVLPVLPEWATLEAQSFLDWLYEGARKKHHAVCVKYGDPTAPEVAESEAKMLAALVKARHGLPEQTFVACDAIKRLWRRAHPMISSYWKELEDTVRQAIATPGVTYPCRKVKIRRDGAWLRIGLPSGRALCYPNPQVDENGKISYTGFDNYKKAWGKVGTYGGKLCIAAGTLVLTRERAWVPIEHITSLDFVWDGENWTPHEGLIPKGRKMVIQAYGAWMTPGHEVLTVDGWKHASQSERHHRAGCRLPDGVEVPRQRRHEVAVAGGLRVRSREGDRRDRVDQDEVQGGHSFVRVYEEGDDRGTQHEARDVVSPGLRGVARHDRPLPVALASRVAQLRRTWHHGVQAVGAVVRQLLGRHGPDLSGWAHAGAGAQQSRVLPQQLRVGNAQGAGQQPPHQRHGAEPVGADDRAGVFRTDRVGADDDLLPAGPGCDGQGAGRAPRRIAEVFDIVNCGPLRRFTVAAGGQPLIVHNCENITQAVAADILAEPMLAVEAEGYEIVLHVHDELVCETPDTDAFTADRLSALMCSDLGWNEGLPLAAAGFETYRYRKD